MSSISVSLQALRQLIPIFLQHEDIEIYAYSNGEYCAVTAHDIPKELSAQTLPEQWEKVCLDETKPEQGYLYAKNTAKQPEILPIIKEFLQHYSHSLQANTPLPCNFLQDVLLHLSIEIVIFDSEQRYIYVSPYAIKDPEIKKWIIGKSDAEYCEYRNIDKEIKDRRRKNFVTSIEQKRITSWEEYSVSKEGKHISHKRSFTPVFNGDDLQYVIGYTKEITQLWLQDERLKVLDHVLNESDNMLLVASMGGDTWEMDYVTKSFGNYLKQVSHNCCAIEHNGDSWIDKFLQHHTDYYAKGQEFSKELALHSDKGEALWLEFRAEPIKGHYKMYWVHHFYDISLRKAQERMEQGISHVLSMALTDSIGNIDVLLAELLNVLHDLLPEFEASFEHYQNNIVKWQVVLPHHQEAVSLLNMPETLSYRAYQQHNTIHVQNTSDSLWLTCSDLPMGIFWAKALNNSKNHTIGVLSLYGQQPTSLQPYQMAILERIAEAAGNIIERYHMHQQLQYLAYHDGVTGAYNRSGFEQHVQHMQTEHPEIVLMVMDIDHFKKINDSLGYSLGDTILQEVTYRLKSAFQGQGAIARLGGDEFFLAVPLQPHMTLDEHAEHVQHCLRGVIHVDHQEVHISASMGVAQYPKHANTFDALMQLANKAMVQAKTSGLAYRAYIPTQSSRFNYLQLENALRSAIQHDQFILEYQPQVDPLTQNLIGVEALLRWLHPQHGKISPLEFIPVAEASGLIIPIGYWVIEQACRDAKIMPENIKISINVSAVQFDQPDFSTRVEEILQQHDISTDRIELELTESMLMRNPEYAEHMMEALNSKGIHIAIDDFGSGYSSLAYLTRFPFQTLKIERMFVSGLSGNKRSATADVIEHTIRLAHKLQIKVVAEGVERIEQLRVLKSLNCDSIQGYYFSPALGLERLLEWISQPTPATR